VALAPFSVHHPAGVGLVRITSRRDWGILSLCLALGLTWIHFAGTMVSVFDEDQIQQIAEVLILWHVRYETELLPDPDEEERRTRRMRTGRSPNG
jgi:hypothetical protein